MLYNEMLTLLGIFCIKNYYLSTVQNLLIRSVEISQLWLVVSKKLRALYEVQLLEICKIPQLNLI